jgi:hypothetical protein
VYDQPQLCTNQVGARGLMKRSAKPAMKGFAALGVARGVVGSRRSGLDKTIGRPTGMYNH